MLRVTCATFGSSSRCGHSGSPTRMTVPLPSWTAESDGPDLARGLARLSGLGLLLRRERLPDRRQHLALAERRRFLESA